MEITERDLCEYHGHKITEDGYGCHCGLVFAQVPLARGVVPATLLDDPEYVREMEEMTR